jgi:hypothetical protein
MELIVPGPLQRLSAADIIRMAGLAEAAIGQEYARLAAIHHTQRQGTLLRGVIDVPAQLHSLNSHTLDDQLGLNTAHSFTVEVEMKSASSWTRTCSCTDHSSLLCVHSVALLYKWVTHPSAFTSVEPSPSETSSLPAPQNTRPPAQEEAVSTVSSAQLVHYSDELVHIISQLSLSDLRSITREYEIVITGLSKAQLADALLAQMQQPEVVRHVASQLEKQQRQFLAALALAGGSMSDDDLRGVFERFSLGQPSQLQRTLLALQSKALLFRTSMTNVDSSSRQGLNGSLMDIAWYVPPEVISALHVQVPVTLFDLERVGEKYGEVTQQLATPLHFLDQLFLIARALEGYMLQPTDNWSSPGSISGESTSSIRHTTSVINETTATIPPPADMPSSDLLIYLQTRVSLPVDFLSFAIRLLHSTEILYADDTARLRLLPNAIDLLLGFDRIEVLSNFFSLWLKQSSYSELFNLRESGIRVCCRATVMGVPIMRPGELDAENSEARQLLAAIFAQIAQGQWITFHAFARFMYRLNPLFLQKRQHLFSSPHWWLEQETKRPLNPLQWNDWLRGEMHYIARLVVGPLYWFGLCDHILSSDGRLLAFRLTPISARLLQRETMDSPNISPRLQEAIQQVDAPESSLLSIEDTNELLVPCSAQAYAAIKVLEQFTEPVGVHDGNLRYRLTPGAFSEALRHGSLPSSLLALLQEMVQETDHDTRSLALLSRLEQWMKNYGRVRIYTDASVLETIDTTVMRELSATTTIDTGIVQTIQPTVLLLKPGVAEGLSEDIKRRGQAPLVHNEEMYGPA